MTERSLLLLRHAKSSWDDPSLDDFDRPLAKRGREAAPRIGKEMARRGWLPDLALVSPAARTRQTFGMVAAELPVAPAAAFDRSIYEAPAGRILAAIRAVGDEVRTLLVVGHNPGLEDLASDLASSRSDSQALALMSKKFPTGAITLLTFDGSWRDLGSGTARLDAFVTPRDLGRVTGF